MFFPGADRTLLEKRLYRDGRFFGASFTPAGLAGCAGKLNSPSIRLVHAAYQYELSST